MRAASDVGGTFTDLVFYEIDEATGKCGAIKSAKADTTPPNFEQGVMNALAKAGVSPAALDFFAHGSTVVINALTERKGVKTGLITTKGFRDVLEIARGNRPDLFNFNFIKPAPFIERHLRAELTERVTYKGEIQTPVDLSPLSETLAYFRSEGVEAIAVCFLHAYVEPCNERLVAEKIQQLWPEVSVLASHQISREWREYERTSTTVLAAYVHPIAKKYIESLERKLDQGGFHQAPYMMQSNGGITTAAAAKANPITMVESGPASGIYAASYLGQVIDEPNLIVLDIGGTTAKCALIENGEVKVTTEYHIEKTRTAAGYPIQTPVSEIVEIGNGGGSIAWVDQGDKLHVGPQSAGAMPGPAAYGKGGTMATTTDANLVLGRIDPENFVGGERQPDWDAMDRAFKPLMDRLHLTKEEVARGIVRIANANMTQALRLVSTNKGYDPRDFALMAFGGGGAMHAVALARELKVKKVIVPTNSAVFSAWGMLLTDLRRDYVLTKPLALSPENAEAIGNEFALMRRRATADYESDVVKLESESVVFDHYLDLRYLGQEHTVKVPCSVTPEGAMEAAVTMSDFHDMHEKRFTYRLDNDVEIVNFHLVAKVPIAKPELAKKPVTDRTLEDTILHYRDVDFDEDGIHRTAIYNGLGLEPGMTFSGPAIIEEPSVTLVVPPGSGASIDNYGNYIIELGKSERTEK